jgi:AhpD family alkylhydroperoxidase
MHTTTQQRSDIRRHAPDAYRALAALERSLAASTLETPLRELVKLRASQLNGCAYCLRTHARAAHAAGISDAHLDMLAAWHDAPVFSQRERAALALTDQLTVLAPGGLSDDVYDEAAEVFGDDGIAALVFTIATINAWNRLHVAARTTPPVA